MESLMTNKDPGSEKLSPVTFYYFNLTGTESFCAQLFSRLESDQYSVLRYGKRFYEDFYQHGDILLQFLWEKAGWKL